MKFHLTKINGSEDIKKQVLSHFQLEDSDLHIQKNSFGTLELTALTFQDPEMLQFQIDDKWHLSNCIFEAKTEVVISLNGDIVFEDCVFGNSFHINARKSSTIKFEDCEFKGPITIDSIEGTTSFSGGKSESEIHLYDFYKSNLHLFEFNVQQLSDIDVDYDYSRVSRDETENYISLLQADIETVLITNTRNYTLEISECQIQHLKSFHADVLEISSYSENHQTCPFFSSVEIFAPSKLTISNFRIENELRITNVKSPRVSINNVQFSDKSNFYLEECITTNWKISNLDLTTVNVGVSKVSFEESSLFNINWNSNKPLDILETENAEYRLNNHGELRDTYRTLKIAYKKSEDMTNFLFFFEKELEVISKSPTQFNANRFEDQFILTINRIIGFGNSVARCLLILLIESIIFLSVFCFLNDYHFSLNFPGFETLLDLLGKILNPTFSTDKGGFENLNNLLLLIHRFFLGFIYYQIVFALRKYSRK